MKHIAFITLAILLFMLSLSSCTHRPVIGNKLDLALSHDQDNPLTNELVSNQTGLALPDSWSFKRSDNEIEPGDVAFTLFDLKNNNGTGQGFVQYRKTQSKVSAYKAAEWYEGISDSEKDRILYPTTIDGRQAYVLSSITKKDGFDTRAAIIPGKNSGINIVWLLADARYFTDNPEVPYSIFNSYKDKPEDYSYRRVAKGMWFECDDGAWHWSNDYHDGFYIADGKKVKLNSLIGIRSGNDYESVRDLYGADAELDISPFSPTINIADGSYQADAIGMTSNGFYKITYLFERNNNKYILYLGVDIEDTYKPPEELHEIPEIIEALNGYIHID